jgi:hypothetical protein
MAYPIQHLRQPLSFGGDLVLERVRLYNRLCSSVVLGPGNGKELGLKFRGNGQNAAIQLVPKGCYRSKLSPIGIIDVLCKLH